MTRGSLAGLSLRDLEYAVAVGQRRHFGRAAQACSVSQPALSEQIRKLEDVLGFALFERGRRVQPTSRGQALLRQAERVLGEARQLLALAQEAAVPMTGTLRLGAIATLGAYYLPHLLRRLRAAWPRLALRLSEQQTLPLLAALRDGQIDAALLALPVPQDGLLAEPLFHEPFHLVCPATHRLATRAQIRLADLVDDDLILLEEGHCLRDQALALCDIRPAGSRQATGIETLWHMIAAGEGFSLLPALSLAGRTEIAGLLVSRELAEPAGREIALVFRASDPRRSEWREVAAELRAHLPEGIRSAGGM